MTFLLKSLMCLNAALFFFGALQHAGVPMGKLREPRIIPAAIVETLCGLALIWGVTALFAHWPSSRRIAVGVNVVAAGGVLLGIGALALGAGPRTPSNDLYHRVMLALIALSLLILVFARPAET